MDDLYTFLDASVRSRRVPTQEEIDIWNAGKIRATLNCAKCGKVCEADWHLDYPIGLAAFFECKECTTDIMTMTITTTYG